MRLSLKSLIVSAALVGAASGSNAQGAALTRRRSSLKVRGGAAPIAGAVVAAPLHRPAGATVTVPTLSGGETEDRYGPLRCILGGMLIHVALGTLYCWGNFITYAPRSLMFFDGGAAAGRTPDALYVLPGSIIFQVLGLNIGSRLNNIITPRKTALLGGLVFALAVYLASFQTRLASFMAFYSVLFGTAIGTAYTGPLVMGWTWLPKRRGLVNGLVIGAFGAGGFFGNKIGSAVCNPNGLQMVNGLFPQEVYDNFPKMLRTLAACYLASTAAGNALLCARPGSNGGVAAKAGGGASSVSGLTCSEALKTPQFWMLWAMIAASATAGLNMASVYKRYGSTVAALNDDGFQSMMGGIGALCNGLGRVFWALMVDAFGFVKPFACVTALQALTMVFFTRLSQSKGTFALAMASIFFCLGGNFAMAPTVVARIFGTREAAQIFAVLFSAFATAAIGGSSLTKALLASGDWAPLFTAMAAASGFAFVVNTQLRPIAEK